MKYKSLTTDGKKPYFDQEGNLFLPTTMKFGGQFNPKLTAREWLVLQWLNTDNKEYAPEGYKERLVGSRTTYWRARKSLKEKGFISG